MLGALVLAVLPALAIDEKEILALRKQAKELANQITTLREQVRRSSELFLQQYHKPEERKKEERWNAAEFNRQATKLIKLKTKTELLEWQELEIQRRWLELLTKELLKEH